ncbi:MAG: hypothetical protein AMJ54_04040 [Deltaproteobacteria bacterium SG8_13]|nr:MAG: hypothetical protein AMJ54_04040 [Deltaproteobacteria bacterium SG8_13]
MRSLGIAVIALFLLAGCIGGQIKENRRIPLAKDTAQSGIQSDVDWVIDYRYVFRQTDLQQPGKIELSFTLQRKRGFYSLTVFVNYLGGEGRVLGKNAIYNLGNRSGVVQVNEGPFETPPGTVAIAFTSVSRDFKSKQ